MPRPPLNPFQIVVVKEYLESLGGKPIAEDGTKLNGLPLEELTARAEAWKAEKSKKKSRRTR
jgi:hypothetical protein